MSIGETRYLAFLALPILLVDFRADSICDLEAWFASIHTPNLPTHLRSPGPFALLLLRIRDLVSLPIDTNRECIFISAVVFLMAGTAAPRPTCPSPSSPRPSNSNSRSTSPSRSKNPPHVTSPGTPESKQQRTVAEPNERGGIRAVLQPSQLRLLPLRRRLPRS